MRLDREVVDLVMPQGLKPGLIFGALAARLKPCPFSFLGSPTAVWKRAKASAYFCKAADRGSDSGANQLFFFAVVAFDVLVEDFFELGHDGVAAQRGGELAINVDRGLGLFKRAGQTDAQISVL